MTAVLAKCNRPFVFMHMEAIERIDFLFNKYIGNTITRFELEELIAWMHAVDDEQLTALSEAQNDLWEKAKRGDFAVTEPDWTRMLENIKNTKYKESPVRSIRRIWWSAAAAVILIAGAGVFYFTQNKKTEPILSDNSRSRIPEKIFPNCNKTILRSANGKEIILDSALNGDLADQGIAAAKKIENGKIAYEKTNAVVEYHTLTVPRGGRPYQVTLSDGSKIWVNVSSSLRYPTDFIGNTREVELTGEGYFEIAKDPKRPFHVKNNSGAVEVLGTHFNVMAYDDEKNMETTLLEGSVEFIASDGNSILIKPGEKSVLARASNHLTVTIANTELATAWIKGYFQFDKTSVPDILREVGRWYDLDIEYWGNIPRDLYSGKIERNLPLSGVLKLFEQEKINMKIEGKKLIIF